MLKILLILIFAITLCGCQSHEQFVDEQIKTIKTCKDAGVGVIMGGDGKYYCDTK